ncbi:helix-turn-helix domain-containing protein [Streptomyces sp. MST-110588]|uniref:helix-turn-helix domain-containing protein n=1 Tax=Streptomyces sp. MST-110588 TaxID=2833628 RepID=UPI001F5C1BEB|nr:helix-turn-helix domain-containing protein [Streptomyces sp. MST-110588]UNO42408.1 helix-turn-helix domain-containing protein [Streptomyces sp. MST-110588]
MAPDNGSTFGQRVRHARERKGLSRPVLAGLVGRSAEWVKAIEGDRLAMPRLPLLLRLADALGVDDLASLTGDERIAAATYTKGSHPCLLRVKEALTSYEVVVARDAEPASVAVLADRVAHAWHAWHGVGDHRSRVADLLPALLADLQHAARTHEGADRRRVLALLAQTYHLAQLYLSFQPAPDLLMLASDRAMQAAQDADSPRAIAAAAWYLNHLFRDAGEQHEARVDLAVRATTLLGPGRGPEDLALTGLLDLAAALSYAKVGQKGSAERHWAKADEAARRLGAYLHPWLIFGQGMVDAYAITMNNDLVLAGAAVDAATHIDLGLMPSATRRSFHIIETARAHSLHGEPIAVVHLLKKAVQASPETAMFNIFARGAALDLSATGSPIIREDARSLARQLGVAA